MKRTYYFFDSFFNSKYLIQTINLSIHKRKVIVLLNNQDLIINSELNYIC